MSCEHNLLARIAYKIFKYEEVHLSVLKRGTNVKLFFLYDQILLNNLRDDFGSYFIILFLFSRAAFQKK